MQRIKSLTQTANSIINIVVVAEHAPRHFCPVPLGRHPEAPGATKDEQVSGGQIGEKEKQNSVRRTKRGSTGD